jgi:hypothetical protein
MDFCKILLVGRNEERDIQKKDILEKSRVCVVLH